MIVVFWRRLPWLSVTQDVLTPILRVRVSKQQQQGYCSEREEHAISAESKHSQHCAVVLAAWQEQRYRGDGVEVSRAS